MDTGLTILTVVVGMIITVILLLCISGSSSRGSQESSITTTSSPYEPVGITQNSYITLIRRSVDKQNALLEQLEGKDARITELEAEVENLLAGVSARDEELADRDLRLEGLIKQFDGLTNDYAALEKLYDESQSDLEDEQEAKRDALDDLTRLTAVLEKAQLILREV